MPHRLMPRRDPLVMIRIAGCTSSLTSDLDDQEKHQERGTSGMPATHGTDCNLVVPSGE